MILDFRTWLGEGRVTPIPPSILSAYDSEFRRQLEMVIARVRHPGLRAELQNMLDCPVRDRRGHCRSFAEYIYAALLHNGIQHRYDIEAALQYVVEKMLLDRSETAGQTKVSLFGGFKEKPDYTGGNPLLVRFLSYLRAAVRNIRNGRIPRLLNTRQDGMLSIRQGRKGEGDVLADELPARPDSDAALGEMIE